MSDSRFDEFLAEENINVDGYCDLEKFFGSNLKLNVENIFWVNPSTVSKEYYNGTDLYLMNIKIEKLIHKDDPYPYQKGEIKLGFCKTALKALRIAGIYQNKFYKISFKRLSQRRFEVKVLK